MQDIITNLRFSIFHSIYSQIETTNRIIIKKTGLSKKIKHTIAVNKLTKVYKDEEITLIDFLRNSIHNNGIHFPIDKNKESWEINFKDKRIVFKKGEKVNLNFKDIIQIINLQIENTKTILRHPQIQAIEITEDNS